MLNDNELQAILEAVEQQLEKKLRPLVDKHWASSIANLSDRTDLAAELATLNLNDPVIQSFSKNEAKSGAEMAFALTAVDETTSQATQDFMAEYLAFVTGVTEAMGVLLQELLKRLMVEKLTEFMAAEKATPGEAKQDEQESHGPAGS